MVEQQTVQATAKPPKSVKPADGAFDRPSKGAKSAAVFGPASGQVRNDAANLARAPKSLRIVRPISKELSGETTEASDFAADLGKSLQQGHHALGDMTIGAGGHRSERNAISFDKDVVF